MKDYFTFAASFENGNVQLWDIRRPDRYERMFTAHTGPVFCCDWHPDDRLEEKHNNAAAKYLCVQELFIIVVVLLFICSPSGDGWPQEAGTRW